MEYRALGEPRYRRSACTWNCNQLEQLWTPSESLETPNEIIVHLGDVQKAGVLAGVRPGLQDV